MDPTSALLVHAAATWFMVGVIWFVQVVHYPLFGQVGEAAFPAWQAANVRRTTLVVGPAMGVEAATALGLPFLTPGPLAWLGLGLLALCWLSTALLQVPCHGRLERSFDGATGRRLWPPTGSGRPHGPAAAASPWRWCRSAAPDERAAGLPRRRSARIASVPSGPSKAPPMFGWLRRSNPRQDLEKQYRKAMEQARDIQRQGDIKAYAARIEEAEQIRARLDALDADTKTSGGSAQ